MMGISRDGFFRICLFITLGFGVLLSDLHYARSPSWAILLLYFLSATIQRWIMAGKSFDVKALTLEENERIEESKRLYFCGSSLESGSEDPEKTAIREILDPRRALFRKVAKYGVVALYVALIVRFRLSIHVSDLFFLAGSVVFLMAATTGHMLLALALNAVVAVPFAYTLDFLSTPLTLVFLFLTTLTFAAHRFYEEARRDHTDEPDWLDSQYAKMLRHSALSALAFVVLAFCVDRILPDPHTEASKPVIPEKLKKLNRELGERRSRATLPEATPGDAVRAVRGLRAALGERGGDPGKSDMGPLLKVLENAKSAGGKISRDDARAILSRLPSSNVESDAGIEKAAHSLEEALESGSARGSDFAEGVSDGDLEKLREGLEGGLTPAEAEKILASIPLPAPSDTSDLAQATRNLQKSYDESVAEGKSEIRVITPREIEELTNGIPQSRLPIEEAKRALSRLPKISGADQTQRGQAIRALEKATEAGIRNGDPDVKGLSSAEFREVGAALASSKDEINETAPVKPIQEAVKTAERSADRIEKKPSPLFKKMELPKPPVLISEETLKSLILLLKALLVVISLLSIYFFMRKIWAEHDPESLEENTLRKLTREEKKTLWSELRAIEGAGLTESEEVIARYHLFLKIMATINLAKPESIPPTEYGELIRGWFPKMDSPLSTVTHGFCDVFYGELALGIEGLKRFRADHGRILKNFL